MVRWVRPERPPPHFREMLRRSNSVGMTHATVRLLLISFGVVAMLFATNERNLIFSFGILMLLGLTTSLSGPVGFGHELFHQSVFTSRRMNRFFFVLFFALSLTNPGYFSLTHLNHHRFTGHPLDREFQNELPRQGLASILQLISIDLRGLARRWWILLKNSSGMVPDEFDLQGMRDEIVTGARWVIAIQIGIASVATFLAGWMGAVLVLLVPGSFQIISRGLANLQHAGGEVGQDDFRHNTNSVRLNRVLEVAYAEMNFHLEHHLYPGVPFYNLHSLSQRLSDTEFVPQATFVSLFGILRFGCGRPRQVDLDALSRKHFG